MLTAIVLAEDQLRYERPPSFWNSNLTTLLGWSVDKLDRVRKKLLAMDLLHYDRDTCRDQAIYWVKTPAWFVPAPAEPSATSSAPLRNLRTGAEGVAEHLAEGVAEHPAEPPTPNSPITLRPNPPPSPPSRERSPLGAEWAAVEREMIEVGIGEPSEPMRSLQSHQVPASLALGVLRFASETGAWDGGKIRRRLINLRPGQDPRQPRLWMKPDRPHCLPPALRVPTATQQATACDRDEDRRLRQMLLDFGAEVTGKTIREIVEAYEVPPPLRERLSAFQRWEHIRSGTLQLAVLEIVSRHIQPTPN